METSSAVCKDSPRQTLSTAQLVEFTEYKRAEEALRESELKYSTLVENAKDGVAVVQDEIYVFANTAFKKITGYNMKELSGMNFIDIVAPESKKTVLGRYRERVAGKRVPEAYEMKLKHKDGTMIDVELSATAIDYLGRPASMAIVHDITKHKRAENVMQQSEAKYSAVVENSKDAIVIIQDGVFKFVNSASKELFGYSTEEMVGASFFYFAAPDCQELVKERYRDRIAGKKVPSVYEINILRKDGTEIPVEANANRISFNGKSADLAFLRDITERKKASHDLGERFKELTCLYSLSQLIVKNKSSIDQVLKETVELIPPSWQYPDISCARITFNGKCYQTDNFKTSKGKQSSDIVVVNKKYGSVEL